MIEVTEKAESEIKYPVGRKNVFSGMVVIFWNEYKGTVVCKGTSDKDLGYTTGDWDSCWTGAWKSVDIEISSVDIEISAEGIILGGSESTEDKIVYPVAKQHRKEGMTVIYTDKYVGVIIDPGNDKHKKVGDSYRMLDEDSLWKAVTLKICG